jgi:hypothetical protein
MKNFYSRFTDFHRERHSTTENWKGKESAFTTAYLKGYEIDNIYIR